MIGLTHADCLLYHQPAQYATCGCCFGRHRTDRVLSVACTRQQALPPCLLRALG